MDILAIILVTAAVWIAATRSDTTTQATSRIGGFLVTLFFLLGFGLFILDDIYRETPHIVQDQWSDVFEGVDLSNVPNPLNTAPPLPVPDAAPPPVPNVNPLAPAPQPTAVTDVASSVYVVEAGDTLFEIAKQYRLDVDELARANNLDDVNTIEVGQRLVIPGRGGGQMADPPLGLQPTVDLNNYPWLNKPVPTQAVPQPTPQPPTPVDLTEEYEQILAFKYHGLLEEGTAMIRNLLGENSDDTRLQGLSAEVSQASSILASWVALGETVASMIPGVAPSHTYGRDSNIKPLLDGFTFEVIYVGGVVAHTKWQEASTLRCVSPGWLFDVEFTIARGHLRRLNVKKEGDIIDLE